MQCVYNSISLLTDALAPCSLLLLHLVSIVVLNEDSLAVWQNNQGLCDTSCLFQLLSLQHSFNYRSVMIGHPSPPLFVPACIHTAPSTNPHPCHIFLQERSSSVIYVCTVTSIESCSKAQARVCTSSHSGLIRTFILAHQEPYLK